MNASANDRHRLHAHLEQLLGPEDAATLMEHLPPDEWNQLATKADVLGLREEFREFRQEFRQELHQFRQEHREDIEALERRVNEHTDLRVRAVVGDSTRVLFFSMLASQATLVGLVLAAAKLG